MNIFEKAKAGQMTPEVEKVAEIEGLSPEYVLDEFARGRICIFKNSTRDIDPVGVGKGLTTKINANIGTSPDLFDLRHQYPFSKSTIPTSGWPAR